MIKIGSVRKKIQIKFSDKLLSNDNKRWPAIMLAARRTESVIGRIKFLIFSIKTIKKDKIIGVPKGSMWEKVFSKNSINP